MAESPFDIRRQEDPQGVINDLIAQTARQAKEINRLNKLVQELQEQSGTFELSSDTKPNNKRAKK